MKHRRSVYALAAVTIALIVAPIVYAPHALDAADAKFKVCSHDAWDVRPDDHDAFVRCVAPVRRTYAWTALIPWLRKEARRGRENVEREVEARELHYVLGVRADRGLRTALIDRCADRLACAVTTGSIVEVARVAPQQALGEHAGIAFVAAAATGGADALAPLMQRPSWPAAAWKCWKGDVAGGRMMIRSVWGEAGERDDELAIACGVPLGTIPTDREDIRNRTLRNHSFARDIADPARSAAALRHLDENPFRTVDHVALAIEHHEPATLGAARVAKWKIADLGLDVFDKWYFLNESCAASTPPARLLAVGERLEAFSPTLRELAARMYFGSATAALRRRDHEAARVAIERYATIGDAPRTVLLWLAAADADRAIALAEQLESGSDFGSRPFDARATIYVHHLQALIDRGRYAEAYALATRAAEPLRKEVTSRHDPRDKSLNRVELFRFGLALKTGDASLKVTPWTDHAAAVGWYRVGYAPDLFRTVQMTRADRRIVRGLMGSAGTHLKDVTPVGELLLSAVLGDDGDAEVWLDSQLRLGGRYAMSRRAEAARFRGDLNAEKEWTARVERLWSIVAADPESIYVAKLGF